ncbi:hypothetical protein O3P69_013886 [Scylla paramamosain]|uniref:Uncharacterized protein n=2 Tax=Scylla paramamosain TaxID=85552 RepID=A0AAW0SR34_SCYPA
MKLISLFLAMAVALAALMGSAEAHPEPWALADPDPEALADPDPEALANPDPWNFRRRRYRRKQYRPYSYKIRYW